MLAAGDGIARREQPPRRAAGAGPVKLTRTVPFPRPRPGHRDRTGPQAVVPEVAPPPAAETAADAAQQAAAACLAKLTPDLAAVRPLPPVNGTGACGIAVPVRLEAVQTRGGKAVALRPAAVVRCEMAEAIVHWVREDLDGATQELAGPLAALIVDTSYECRGRNRVDGARLSEHGLGNAIDLRAIALADGTLLSLTDLAVAKELRLRVQGSACARFTTVLGPGSDAYHATHVHLDLRERRGGYRICQWDVQ